MTNLLSLPMTQNKRKNKELYMSANPLETIVFIQLPETFSLGGTSFALNPSIPLPVQQNTSDVSKFNVSNLTWEMILAGVLTILAYDTHNEHLAYYRRLLTETRPNIKAELTEAAILKARNENYEIADEIFCALRGLDPDDMTTVLNSALFYDERAESYRKSGLHEDADACDETAGRFYKKSLTAEPAIPDAFFNAGFFYLKQKDFSHARNCFETYSSLMSSFTDESDENTRYKIRRSKEIADDIASRNLEDELFKSAYDFIVMEQEEKGLEKIKLFIEKNPKVWNAWFMLGWALRRLERWHDAKSAFLQALELGGDNADTFNEIAICCMELHEFSESRKMLHKALQIESENTKIMSNLGFLALKEGNPGEARKFFLSVLEFDPSDKTAQKMLEDMDA